MFDYSIKDYAAKYYKEEAPVARAARAFKMVHPEKAKIAILGCHGFTGYPGELARPAKDLYEAGFDVFVPRYPGHGTSGEDFIKTDRHMWLGAATDCCKDLQKEYDKVYIIGHSMGGLIASIIATEEKLDRAVLFAPAFALLGPIWATPIIKIFRKKIKTKWTPNTEFPAYYEGPKDVDQAIGNDYWAYNYPREANELRKLKNEAKKIIKNMDCNVLTFIGSKDEAVTPEACTIVARANQGISISRYLEGATHLIQYDICEESREEAITLCVKWFQEEKIKVE